MQRTKARPKWLYKQENRQRKSDLTPSATASLFWIPTECIRLERALAFEEALQLRSLTSCSSGTLADLLPPSGDSKRSISSGFHRSKSVFRMPFSRRWHLSECHTTAVAHAEPICIKITATVIASFAWENPALRQHSLRLNAAFLEA